MLKKLLSKYNSRVLITKASSAKYVDRKLLNQVETVLKRSKKLGFSSNTLKYARNYKELIKNDIKINNYVISHAFNLSKLDKHLIQNRISPKIVMKKFIKKSPLYTAIELNNCDDRQFAKQYIIKTNNLIDKSKLGQDFKNEFIALMNGVIMYGNATTAIRRARFVRTLIKRYQPLVQGKNTNQICQYVLSTIAKGNKWSDTFSTLHDVNPVHQGYTIFNFVMHQYNYAMEYYYNVRRILEEKLPSAKAVKKVKPILYQSQNIQIRYALKGFIKHCIHDKHNKNMQEANESWLLSQINLVFNNYLSNIGIIHTLKNGNNQLTKRGKQIINNTSSIIKKFLKRNNFAYQPDKSLSSILIPIINSLKWVKYHPKFNQFYGLIFAQEIIKYKRYKAFCNYTDNKGNARTLALSPMTYASCILSIIDLFFRYPHSNVKRFHTLKVSNALITCLKQFGILDNTTKNIISKPKND